MTDPQFENTRPARERKLERLLYYGLRGATRVVTAPFAYTRESRLKAWVRKAVLGVQHSLPTELAVNKGDLVVQIGTPWPRTLHRFRRAIGDGGRLVIFEAEPNNYERLRRASEAAGYDNVHLVQAAAWSESRPGQLLISTYQGDHKIPQDNVAMDNDLRPANADMETIDVEFRKIDDVLGELGIAQINYLSVTVNGAEFEVLKGAEATLRNSTEIRVYAKGHALLDNGKPLHSVTEPYMRSLGFETKITRGEPSSTKDKRWLWRAGDLFAWKQG